MEKNKTRVVNVFARNPTENTGIPKDLKLVVAGAFMKFKTQIIACKDDFTEQVLEKFRHNIIRLRNDYLVFDNEMNIIPDMKIGRKINMSFKRSFIKSRN